MSFSLPDALCEAWTLPNTDPRPDSDAAPWRDFARRLRVLLAADAMSHADTVRAVLAAGRYVVCAEAIADSLLATAVRRQIRH